MSAAHSGWNAAGCLQTYLEGNEVDTDRNTLTIRFTSCTHRRRFTKLIDDDGMYPGDSERASLFFLISGNEDLYKKRRHIYDMEEHCIRNCLDSGGVDFSSSMRSLIRLGFNLYNGWSDNHTTPLSILGCLDSNNFLLAGIAVMVRFSMEPVRELQNALE